MKAILMFVLGLGIAAVNGLEFSSIDQHSPQQQEQLHQQKKLQKQETLVSESSVPKLITKKSIQDKEVVRPAEHYELPYIPASSSDYSSSQIVQFEPIASGTHGDHDHGHPKVGYSVGGPLVNIAQGAAAQAHTFEKSQPAAAAQAAYVAKNRLGQSAGLSAATAAAAFAGKQIILRGLEQQAYTAHRSLESEKLQLQQAQRAATASAHAAQQAMHQLQVITTALNAAQATSEHASAAAAEAAAELAAQTAMVGAAKARLQAIEDQLHHARIDFEAAQHANFKAAHAAQVAQNNAAAAAAHAAEVANVHHHYHNTYRDLDHGHRNREYRHHDNHQQYGRLGHEQESEHELEEHDYEHERDHDNHESIIVPISTSLSSLNVSSTSSPSNSSSTLVDRENERNERMMQSTLKDYRGALVTVSPKNELYDVYDSFPY